MAVDDPAPAPRKPREEFLVALDEIAAECVDLAVDVRAELRDAVTGLLERDVDAATRAVTAERAVIDRCAAMDDRCALLIATQSPVAGDLRLVLAVVRLAYTLERSARLCGHLARLQAHVDPAGLPADLVERIRRLAVAVDDLYGMAETSFVSRDRHVTAAVLEADAAIDHDAAELTAALVAAGEAGSLGASDLVHLALVARYLERTADHAVGMSEQTAKIVGDRGSSGA